MLDEIYRVSFIGHREITYDFRCVENALDGIITEVTKNKEFIEFYVGKNGDFDTMAVSAVKRYQNRTGKENSALILVIPYEVANVDCYEKFYDEVIYPDELYGIHFKSAIAKRNEWMVDHSDLLIAYVKNNKGGAAHCYKYATAQGKKTRNIAEETLTEH